MLEWFSIQVLVNSEVFKLSLNISLTHFRAKIVCYELKGDLRSVMLKEIIITRQFENFEIYKDLCGKPFKLDWVAKVVFLIQILLIFGGRCNRYFWDIWLKIDRLPNFNMLFQLVLTKFFKSELFSFLPKVDHVINSCKRPTMATVSQFFQFSEHQ